MDAMPDVEGAVRTWLRAQAAVTAFVGQRVFFGVPRKATDQSWPLIVVQRVGGGDDGGDAPIDNALLQIDCWGSIDASGNGMKADCRAVVNAVRSALRNVTGSTTLAPGVDAGGMTVQSDIWLPDPANDRPRYSLTVEVTAIHT